MGLAISIMKPARGYLLCCIERTGSNLLGEALAGTGIAGRPREYFNRAELNSPWLREILGESSLVDGVPKILSAGATPNGVFGAKIHGGHFLQLGLLIENRRMFTLAQLLEEQLPRLLSVAEAEGMLRTLCPDVRWHIDAYGLLRAALPDLRLIWLRRKNMVARAISHYRARQSGRWYRSVSDNGATAAEAAVEFDLARIQNMVSLGAFQDKLWGEFFKQIEVTPHCVFYEELVGDYEGTVRDTLAFLGLDGQRPEIPSPGSRKQSDAQSEEWEARYRQWSAESVVL